MDSTTGRPLPATVWYAALAASGVVLAARASLVAAEFGELVPPLAARLFDGVLPLAVSAAMACAALQTGRVSPRFTRAWVLFSLAYLAYGMGELPFAVLAAPMSARPWALVSSSLYLLFYPLFLLGTLRLPPVPLDRRERSALALDMGVVMFGAVFLLWSFIVMPAMERGEPDFLKVVVTVAFPVAGLAVLWSLLTLSFRRLARPAATTGRLLAGAAALMLVSDAAYSVHLLSPNPRLWSVLPLGWTLSHLLAGLAAAHQLTAVDGATRAAASELPQRSPVASVYLAYLSILVAVLALVGMHMHWLSVVGGLALVGMILLGVAGKVMWLRENERLKLQLRAARDELEQRVQERTAELADTNVSLVREVGERRRAEQRIRLQLDRLGALRAIDTAISSSLDLQVTLEVFLDNVLGQLKADAADVLLLDPVSPNLVCAGRKGFRSGGRAADRVPLGQGPAGQAALERRMIAAPALDPMPGASARDGMLAGEGFACCWAVPLLAKGQVKGVLEVFSRNLLEPDGEWIDFLGVLAGQGAIAVENMSMFERIQRSNVELVLAYESTLEGWSRALELRDQETQGHTVRVTEATVRLAREAGINGDELVHVRRGALLHDIGKMAIPDAVLLKPGPLDDTEWRVMRRHPAYAFELLSHIAYLRPALDIPYCHHERWDGSGYPRGLKGIEIPLAARIFSVVDTWDALAHDRPYRKAWTDERVFDHVRAASGSQFDPGVVETFLVMNAAPASS